MSRNPFRSKAPHVLVAIAVVVGLGALLADRLAARSSAPTAAVAPAAGVPTAPAATVPAPRPIDLRALSVPCWGCNEAKEWPVRYRTDLDLLAPLGTGTANAALWFVQFRKPDGPRRAEAEAARARRVEGPAGLGSVLPPDDPLLLEAEPWADQATMRFYSDLLPVRGWATPIPDLLLAMTLADSWIARGMAAPDPTRAMDDFRRAVRLGRLLRQEDAVLMADLVGMACIRRGAQAIYDLALKQGDNALALVAAVVVGEYSGQRLMTAQHLTKASVEPYLRRGASSEVTLELPGAKLDDIVAIVSSDPDRRFRAEAILQLNIVRFLGTSAQQERALKVLNELAAGGDPVVAAVAAWARETRPTREFLESLGPPVK